MEYLTKFKAVYSENQQNKIKHEFERLKDNTYLDHAGATLYSKNQLEECFNELKTNIFANPHGGNNLGKYTDDAIDVIRYRILDHFNTTPEEYSVVFTSGATGALKLVAECFDYGNNGILAYLNDNHTSVLGMRGLANSSREISVKDIQDIIVLGEERKSYENGTNNNKNSCSLFVYPAQSNFNGTKYPLDWIKNVKKGCLNNSYNNSKWYVLLDAAAFVGTSKLDLSKYNPDFVPISFYKIFGYPTGLGALLVKNSSENVLIKKYFGGGTVEMILSNQNVVVPRKTLHERFEDGTAPFLSIVALKHGFATFRRLGVDIEQISEHTFSLGKYLYGSLAGLRHENGRALVEFYHSTKFERREEQGGTVNFNLLRDSGEYVGYAEVQHFTNLYNIQIRTGCHCNPGACQYYLKLSPEQVGKHYNAGHVCGDQLDLVNGHPTGTIRVSFGYMSTKEDADKLLNVLQSCFLKTSTVPKGISQDFSEKLPGKGHGILTNIFLYPVKSCGAFEVRGDWEIASTGLKYDRTWMIVNSAGVCISQKQNRKLCLIKPNIDLETNSLTLYFEDILDYINIPLNKKLSPKNANLCQSKVCGDKIQGYDCGDDVAEWLSKKLDTPGLRLINQCDFDEEQPPRGQNLSLANKAQYLLINKSSAQWLINKIPPNELDEDINSVIGRFRPNFVIDFEEELIENSLTEIYIGNLKFESCGNCTRCQMICIDQNTGEKTKEPLLTLSKTFGGKVLFGIYLKHIINTQECAVINPKLNVIGLK